MVNDAQARAHALNNSTTINKVMMTFLLILCKDGAYLLIGYAKLCVQVFANVVIKKLNEGVKFAKSATM